MELDLQLDEMVSKVKKIRPKNILIQLPDGLKPRAKEIVSYIEKNTGLDRKDIFLWGGSCFGACDTPDADLDLLIQFGHSRWVK